MHLEQRPCFRVAQHYSQRPECKIIAHGEFRGMDEELVAPVDCNMADCRHALSMRARAGWTFTFPTLTLNGSPYRGLVSWDSAGG